MTAISNTRILTHDGPVSPTRGTGPVAANTQLFKNTLVCQDASGNLIAPAAGAGDVLGKTSAYTDNRTGSEAGGAAGAIEAEYECGVFFWDLLEGESTPLPHTIMYAVDNQTVSANSAGGTLPVAGPVTEVRRIAGRLQVGVFLGPAAAAGVAASKVVRLPVPLGSLRLSTGAAIAAFSDGVADGFQLADSEAFSLRINDDSTTVFSASVALPDDLDDAGAVRVHMLASRVGTADQTAAVTVGAFFQVVGAAHTADANAGGATSAVAVDSVVNEVFVTLAAADVPAGPNVLTLTFQVTAALDADDLLIHGIWLEFTKK